ncbi:helix-hairpin-helix domain-containing protein [Aeromonas veronii]|uniref:ComEA family DNA-binding protein n=1 Tax=Aeromonas TaxID=642 RepID=UPI000DCFDDA0|nr:MULTISPECIES: ComEA family DNA-binding protein [Aeromonas]MBF3238769.1 helix-hairpin-helix domain-containing protein [Aeromonas veronii]MBL0591339.1 helix-hairpin-helix domain-containing protein [Aeromonas veronii]MCF5767444.1 ComEA family DNA-binding protein [Aeromonas veronii]MCF5874468.1 ComEA family DNA-binding protein [Aeromonas veronii]MCQ4109949.1 ComEA family DNA-binding protein [Aeromonas sp. JL9]
MLMKKLSAVMLLACLPLFSQPVLAVDKAAPKQTTTTAVAKESGKLNINTATLAELTSLKGIGDKKAQAIVDYREKQGKFTSVDQLADVNGIGPATLEANRDMIIVK